MTTLVLSIPGLHCGVCRSTVRRVLAAVPGVHGVDVDLRERRATALVDAGLVDAGLVDAAALCAVLARAGYPATQAAPNTGPTPTRDGSDVPPPGAVQPHGDVTPPGAT